MWLGHPYLRCDLLALGGWCSWSQGPPACTGTPLTVFPVSSPPSEHVGQSYPAGQWRRSSSDQARTHLQREI